MMLRLLLIMVWVDIFLKFDNAYLYFGDMTNFTDRRRIIAVIKQVSCHPIATDIATFNRQENDPKSKCIKWFFNHTQRRYRNLKT